MVRGPGLGVLIAVLLTATASPALAAAPSPRPGTPPVPRCHVVPGQTPPKAKTAGNVSVFIPRVVCTPVVHTPPPHLVSGGASGGATAHVPFTGADLDRWALAAVLALAGGTALQLGARRRVVTR